MQNRPLMYWLEYVRSLAGREAPVIVVQSQCDREIQVREAPIPGEHGFTRLQRTACSAKRRDGMERFIPELRAAARLLQERHSAVRLPQSWVKVAEQLRGLHGQGHKTVSWSNYVELCLKSNPKAIPEASIGYLHRSGQVFWRTGIFDEQVVLDQAWALSGIYAVLHRATTLPIIRGQRGIFTKELLAALVWTEYSPEEQSLFLSMMQQCGTCFEVSNGTYIAPGLLPIQATVSAEIEQIWRGQVPDARAHLKYAFLHEGVLRAVLCAIGQRAGKLGVYWDAGIAYYDGKAKGPVRISAEYLVSDSACAAGHIVVEAGGSGAAEIVTHLIDSIQKIRIGQAPEIEWEVGDARKVTEHESAHSKGDSERLPFEIQPTTVPPKNRRPSVYLSYAWGGESDKTVEALQNALDAWVDMLRDKNVMRTGDSIRQFEEEIGRGLCVVIVLGERYTRSVDCMRELGFIWERSQRNADQFAQRIIPVVLEDAGIGNLAGRLKCVQHWQEQLKELDNLVREIGPVDCGQSTTQQLQDIKTFTVHLADALNTFADRVMPRAHALSSANFEPVVELVKRRFEL